MNIDEMIDRLQKLKIEHGNIQVGILNKEEFNFEAIENVYCRRIAVPSDDALLGGKYIGITSKIQQG